MAAPSCAHTSPSQSASSAPTNQPSIACGPPMAPTMSGMVMKGPTPTMSIMLSAVASFRPSPRTSFSSPGRGAPAWSRVGMGRRKDSRRRRGLQKKKQIPLPRSRDRDDRINYGQDALPGYGGGGGDGGGGDAPRARLVRAPAPGALSALWLRGAGRSGCRRAPALPPGRAGGDLFHTHRLDGVHPDCGRGRLQPAGRVAAAEQAKRIRLDGLLVGAALARLLSLQLAAEKLGIRGDAGGGPGA